MNEILISNLDKLVNSKYLSEKNPNLWRAIPYRTKDFSGVMLGDGGGHAPLPLTIRLGVKGLYRIKLGIHGLGIDFLIRAKLSRDLCCRRLGISNVPSLLKTFYKVGPEGASNIYEIFWKESDLTGQNLILEGAYKLNAYTAALAYIRLEPIKKILARPKKKKAHYPLVISNEGQGMFGKFPHSRPEDLLEHFEHIPYGRRDIDVLLWGSGDGDMCNYPTKVGNLYVSRRNFNYHNDVFGRNMKLWKKKGWNSLKLMREYAKKREWEFHVYIRMEAFATVFPYDQRIPFYSEFFHKHPEYHCFDRNGQRVGRLSYAYPEVQEHMLDLISEIAGYNPDGICLCFVRGVPLVLYEPIMVEGFRKKYGIDPRKLKETDSRWMEYQGEVITSFVRKAKEILKPGQRLSAIVPGKRFDCLRWGLDVAGWVEEGLIKDLYPHAQTFTKYDSHWPYNPTLKKLDFKYFNGLKGREKIRLIPMFYGNIRHRLMQSVQKQEAFNGCAFWDGGAWLSPDDEKEKFSRPENKPRRVKMLTMQGIRMDRYHHHEVT